MEKTLIDHPAQWMHIVKNKSSMETGQVYINQKLALEFHTWAVKQSALEGLRWGFGAGLLLAVILAIFVKLMVL
jgi:hypothetical protein